MSDKPLVLLFVKAPIKGRVKSRLAAGIGVDHTLQLYKNFVLDTIEMLDHCGYEFMICFSPADEEKLVANWLGGRHRYMPQHGRDIGERMEDAFRRVFSEAVSGAILIGSDIPDLTVSVVREAAGCLDRNDAVIGRASDGGYYLIGFTRNSFLPDVFHNIQWGGPKVFEDTITKLENASLRIHVAPEWHDVDSRADLKALFVRNEHTEFRRSRTMDYLNRYPNIFLG